MKSRFAVLAPLAFLVSSWDALAETISLAGEHPALQEQAKAIAKGIERVEDAMKTAKPEDLKGCIVLRRRLKNDLSDVEKRISSPRKPDEILGDLSRLSGSLEPSGQASPPPYMGPVSPPAPTSGGLSRRYLIRDPVAQEGATDILRSHRNDTLYEFDRYQQSGFQKPQLLRRFMESRDQKKIAFEDVLKRGPSGRAPMKPVRIASPGTTKPILMAPPKPGEPMVDILVSPPPPSSSSPSNPTENFRKETLALNDDLQQLENRIHELKGTSPKEIRQEMKPLQDKYDDWADKAFGGKGATNGFLKPPTPTSSTMGQPADSALWEPPDALYRQPWYWELARLKELEQERIRSEQSAQCPTSVAAASAPVKASGIESLAYIGGAGGGGVKTAGYAEAMANCAHLGMTLPSMKELLEIGQGSSSVLGGGFDFGKGSIWSSSGEGDRRPILTVDGFDKERCRWKYKVEWVSPESRNKIVCVRHQEDQTPVKAQKLGGMLDNFWKNVESTEKEQFNRRFDGKPSLSERRILDRAKSITMKEPLAEVVAAGKKGAAHLTRRLAPTGDGSNPTPDLFPDERNEPLTRGDMKAFDLLADAEFWKRKKDLALSPEIQTLMDKSKDGPRGPGGFSSPQMQKAILDARQTKDPAYMAFLAGKGATGSSGGTSGGSTTGISAGSTATSPPVGPYGGFYQPEMRRWAALNSTFNRDYRGATEAANAKEAAATRPPPKCLCPVSTKETCPPELLEPPQ